MTDVATNLTDPAAPVRTAPDWPRLMAIMATALVTVLTVFRLDDKSFWHDEGFSVGLVDRAFGDALWRMAHWELNQSPFFLILAGWWRLGQSETFLRLLPAMFAIAAVPALFDLGRRMFDRRVGAVAALLLACHSLVIEWGQQLRGYSLVLLLTIIATTLLLRAVAEPTSTSRALTYAGVAALATYSHFFAGLVVGAHLLWILVQRPLPRRLLLVAGGGYAVLVIPLAEFLVNRNGDPLNWVARAGTLPAVRATATALTGGTRSGIVSYSVAAGIGAGLTIWAAVRTGAGPGPGTDSGDTASRDRRVGLLAVAWLAVPVGFTVASTVTVKPLLEARFLIVVLPALVLLAALGVCRLGQRAGAVLLALLLITSARGVDRWYSTETNQDWRTATMLVGEVSPDADVVIAPWGGTFTLWYYEDRFGVPRHHAIALDTRGGPASDPLIEIRGETASGQFAPVAPEYVRWRDRHYVLESERRATGITVRTYRRP